MSTDWTPFDFILHGEFAGTDHLRDIVGRVRVATNSVCSLSIIYQAGESFQSLMYVRHEEPGQENALQAGLASYSLTRDDRNSIEELLKAPRVDRLPRLLDRSARRLFEGICEAFGDVTSRMAISELQPRLAATGPHPAKVGVLCIGTHDEVPRPLMDELTIAIHASAPVYLHRIRKLQEKRRAPFQRLNTEIRQHFEDRAGGASGPDSRHGADKLAPLDRFLREVLVSTGATQGAVYMNGDKHLEVVPAARLGPGEKPGEFIPYTGGPIQVKKGGGVVSEVHRRCQVILYNNARDFERMVPKIGLRQFSGDSKARSDAGLAVPIIDKSKANYPVIGVLNVEKSLGMGGGTEKPRPFTLQDCWFLQEAADRLVAAWMGGWSEALYRIVEDTKRRLRPYAVHPPDSGYSPMGSAAASDLPADFAAIQGVIRDMLVPFCNTASLITACTVRVLSVDQSKLVLLVKHPADLENVPPVVDLQADLQESSPIAQVVLLGAGQSGPASELPTRVDRLESYTCLPLFIETRCVGAVTFASAYPSTFLAYLSDALKAATETVASAIEFAQTQALASILGSTIQVFRSLHEITKIPERSTKNLDAAAQLLNVGLPGLGPAENPPVLSLLRDSRADMTTLAECLSRYEHARRPEQSAPTPRGPCSIRDLVDNLIRMEVAATYFKVEEETAPPGWQLLTLEEDRIAPRVYDVCLDAMSDLIRNARWEMTKVPAEDGKIVLLRRQLGGRSYGCVLLWNRIRQSFPPPLRPRLFREPVRKPQDDRLHYGAFLAAWLIRSVGGDVHLRDSPESTFSIIVEIPLLTSNDALPAPSKETPWTTSPSS